MFGKLLLTLQQFIEALVEQTPDIWLCEIRDALSTVCGVVVGLATVWRVLKRQGFMWKWVSQPFIS
jgi:transposase